KVVGGWADIRDATGNGIEIGHYQMSATWPKTLEFAGGGADVRVGMSATQNSQAVYMSWPSWHTDDIFLEFHASTLPATTLANDSLNFQHYWVARPSAVTYPNTPNFSPYPIVDPTVKDAYYVNTQATANPATIALNKFCYGGGTTNCTPD